MIKIRTITPDLSEKICRKLISDLPAYFGISKVNKKYATEVRSKLNIAASVNEEYVGLISIDFPYPNNANIYWMAVLSQYHRTGVGKALSTEAFRLAKINGAKTISVETLSLLKADSSYIKTYQFYKSLGFNPLFNLKPEGYKWDMVYMLKIIDNI